MYNWRGALTNSCVKQAALVCSGLSELFTFPCNPHITTIPGGFKQDQAPIVLGPVQAHDKWTALNSSCCK